jgi:hypothetical protein
VSDDPKVFEIICPHCHAALWVDPVTKKVLRAEKGGGKPKSSLDELLEKENKRRSEFEQKFEATAELEKQKKQRAKERFEKALADKEYLEDDETKDKDKS